MQGGLKMTIKISIIDSLQKHATKPLNKRHKMTGINPNTFSKSAGFAYGVTSSYPYREKMLMILHSLGGS